jgi:hypothetical protein
VEVFAAVVPLRWTLPALVKHPRGVCLMSRCLRVRFFCALAAGLVSAIFASIASAQPQGTIFWVDGVSQLGRVNVDGSGYQTLFTGLGKPVSVDVDPASQHVYWVENSTMKIRRANFDGSGLTEIGNATRPPNGLSLDYVASKLYYTYWVQGPHVQIAGVNRVDTNGANDILVYGDDVSIPRGIEADTPDGYIYYGATPSGTVIDAVDKTTFVATPNLANCGACHGVTFGVQGVDPKVFFSSGGTIKAMDPNGANLATLPLPVQANIMGVDAWGLVSNIYLAWGTDLGGTGTIAYSKTDGTDFQVVHTAAGMKYTDVAVVPFVPPVPEPAGLTLACVVLAGAGLRSSLSRERRRSSRGT